MASWWPWCCCTDCDFADDFTTTKSGYSDQQFGGVTPPNYSAGGGVLSCEIVSGTVGDDGSHTQAITRPALSGLLVSVRANIANNTGYDPDGNGIFGYVTTGVCIGKANNTSRIAFFRQWSTANRYSLVFRTTAGVATTRAITVTEANPIKLEIEDVSSGAGTYDIRCSVGGSVAYTESSVALTLPTTLDMGVVCTDGGRWTDLCIDWT